MDIVSVKKRSEIMSKVRSRDTKPEMFVRKIVSSLGFRYRLHNRNLPGKPDLSNATRKKAIFVHGCFWHRHANCKMASVPASNKEYWKEKFRRNKLRDQAALDALKKMGWRPLVVWECEIRQPEKLKRKLEKYVGKEA